MRSLDRAFKSRLNGTGLKPLVQYIKDLFNNNEQGVWYDPSDLTTLYQDAAGTIPVTAVEQPVGLMLDKSRGLVLGPELVPLPLSFYSGWSPLTATVDSAVTFTTKGAGGVAFPITNGKSYRITISGSTTASAILVGFRNPSGGYTTPLINSVNGIATATALSTESQLYIRNIDAGTTTINSISVRELPGAHASQTTATSRPVLSARVNLLTKTEDLSHSDWTSSTSFAYEAATDPNGGNTATKIVSIGVLNVPARDVVATANSLDFVFYLKPGTIIPQILIRNKTTATGLIPLSTISTSGSNQYGSWVVTPVSDGWVKFKITLTSGFTAGNVLTLYYGATGLVSTGLFWYVWHPDIRSANSGTNLPDYQRVNTATDYDTVGFPKYIRYDNIDDVSNVKFPTTLGSNCTIARVSVGGSSTILTGQSIGDTYGINMTHSGLMILNRPLTNTETKNVTKYLYQKGTR